MVPITSTSVLEALILFSDGCSVSLSPQFDATGGWDGGVGDILGGIDVIICNKDEARHIAATLSTLKGGISSITVITDILT